MIVEFEDVSATMEGTVIKVETDTEDPNGYYYFGSEYMDDFEGGEFDLGEGTQLPSQIDQLPEGDQETLREGLFQEDEEDVESESE